MNKLYFRYGAMSSGKSAAVPQCVRCGGCPEYKIVAFMKV